MKTSLWIVLLTATVATAALIGCGKSSSNSNGGYQCDQFGNCNPINGNGYGYGGNYFDNQNIAANPNIVAYSGGVNLLNGGVWGDVVKGLGVCGPRQAPNYFYFDLGSTLMCPYMNDAAPRVSLVFNDYKLPNGVTTGTFSIGSMSFQGFSFGVTWRKIDKNTAIDMQVLTPQDPKNRYLRVVFSGRTTDSSAQVTLYHGGTVFGQGYILRTR